MPIERLTFPDEQRYFFPNQLIIPFTKTAADMHAIEFLNKFIAPLNPHKITIGYDFKFGKMATETRHFLKIGAIKITVQLLHWTSKHIQTKTLIKVVLSERH